MATEPPLTFLVQRWDRNNDVTVDLGTVTFGPRGELRIVDVRDNYNEYLSQVVESVNSQDELSIKVPPPPDAKPYGIYYLTVSRTAPDLLDTMCKHLEQKYDLLLVDEE